MTEADLSDAGLKHLSKVDPDFAAALKIINPLPSRSRPAGFEHLTRIIVEQQVSLASAAAIWNRLIEAITPFTPEQLLKFSEEQLRQLGLSRQKATYCRALADAITVGELSLDTLHHLNDTEVQDTLTKVKGIGRWTAEIYMIACLDRQDIWPAGDVALKVALQHLKNLPARPNAEEMDIHGERLRPFRTLAARILWRYYADIVQSTTQKKTKKAV